MRYNVPVARPIPKKKIPRAETIAQQVELFESATRARFRIARAAYDHQDNETQRVIDIIVERLRTAGSGYIRIYPNGKRNPSVAVPITLEQQDQNILFIAMEIVKDLALFDIRLASYEFPKVYCATCGDKLRGGES